MFNKMNKVSRNDNNYDCKQKTKKTRITAAIIK